MALIPGKTGAQEAKNPEAIFLQQKDSVFLVNQSIFIDEKKIKNIELFKKLEQSMDKSVLNQYIPISSGTAFLVNKDGYLMTAFHVIKYMPADSKEEWGRYGFMNFISRYMIPGYLSRGEIREVLAEYKKILKNSDIVITVKSVKSKEYVAKIIDQDDILDLALLKIEMDDQLAPFVISENFNLKAGDSVVTIGYPLQFYMDKFLDDFKPTVTDGIISAIRTDRWDTQHTASINAGNSGGPLLTREGKVVGVNVGAMRNANNIYFSVNSGKIIGWFKKMGRLALLNTSKDN